jgi:hypothetical protein
MWWPWILSYLDWHYSPSTFLYKRWRKVAFTVCICAFLQSSVHPLHIVPLCKMAVTICASLQSSIHPLHMPLFAKSHSPIAHAHPFHIHLFAKWNSTFAQAPLCKVVFTLHAFIWKRWMPICKEVHVKKLRNSLLWPPLLPSPAPKTKKEGPFNPRRDFSLVKISSY